MYKIIKYGLRGLFITIPVFIILVTFRVKSVDCVNQFSKCDKEIINSLESVNGLRIIQANQKINQILKNNRSIKSYYYQIKLNGKYIVNAVSRIPKYCAYNKDKTYFSDSEGVVVKIEQGSNTTTTSCVYQEVFDYNLGDKITGADFFSQKIFKYLNNIKYIGNAWLEGSNLIVEYRGKTRLLFPVEGNETLLVGRTYYIISQFDNIEKYVVSNGNVSVSEIDFRYEFPIIRFI